MPSSIIVFTNELLPFDKIDLATLVYDIDTPWEDCCEDLDLHEDEVRIADESRLYDFIESGLAKGAALDVSFIKSWLIVYMLSDIRRFPRVGEIVQSGRARETFRAHL